jgi:hypothetical protein
VPNTGSIRDDLFQQVNHLSEFINSSKGKVIAEFIAEGQYDADFADEYRIRYFIPRRLISHQIFERAINRGEIIENTDIELCIDLIFAPIFYRLLITGDNIYSDYISKIVEVSIANLFRN